MPPRKNVAHVKITHHLTNQCHAFKYHCISTRPILVWKQTNTYIEHIEGHKQISVLYKHDSEVKVKKQTEKSGKREILEFVILDTFLKIISSQRPSRIKRDDTYFIFFFFFSLPPRFSPMPCKISTPLDPTCEQKFTYSGSS